MPIASVAGVRRMAGMNGSVIPDPLLERLLAVDDQPDEVAQDRRRGRHRARAPPSSPRTPPASTSTPSTAATPSEQIHANLGLG